MSTLCTTENQMQGVMSFDKPVTHFSKFLHPPRYPFLIIIIVSYFIVRIMCLAYNVIHIILCIKYLYI